MIVNQSTSYSMAMLVMKLRNLPSNQFSSLEKNVPQRKAYDGDEGDGYRDAALIFFLSFLLVFLIMFSVIITIFRIIQCVKNLRSAPSLDKYLVVVRTTRKWGADV